MHAADVVKVDDTILQGQDEIVDVKLDKDSLGPTDLVLMGNGWSLPVHRWEPPHLINSSLASTRRPS